MNHPAIVIGKVERWSMVVIYDRPTGEVLHTHQCLTTKGGKHPGRKALERDAQDAMRRAVPEGATRRTTVALLHVDPRKIKPNTLYRVDPKRRLLVPLSMREITRKPRA
jgi:hypothetical protein